MQHRNEPLIIEGEETRFTPREWVSAIAAECLIFLGAAVILGLIYWFTLSL